MSDRMPSQIKFIVGNEALVFQNKPFEGSALFLFFAAMTAGVGVVCAVVASRYRVAPATRW